MAGEVRLDRDQAQVILQTIREVTPKLPAPFDQGALSEAGDLLSAAIAASYSDDAP